MTITATYTDTEGLLGLVVADARMAATGLCAQHPDPDLWHRDDQSEPDFCAGCTAEAVAICRSCPIQSWCERRADGETAGVWAGRPRSQAADSRRLQDGHSCPTGRRARNAAKVKAHRLRRASASG